jgi:hypothetical protein
MTAPDERVRAVAGLGRYTERQARFLVTVMGHAGVCVPRQYARFCGIQYGAKTRKFFSKLVRLGHTSVMECRHNRARLYHVKPRALYRAIGAEECRFRRQMPLGLALHRLMLLDAIVESPDHVWLATAEEKATHLLALTRIVREDLPHVTIREGAGKTVRYFPDHLPIGIHPEGRGVLVFVVTTPLLEDLRAFLIRHAAVLRALPCWTLRLVLPPHLECVRDTVTWTVDDQLIAPMRASTIEEMRWYFEAVRNDRDARTTRRFYLARRSFSHGRTHALHRAWRHEGDTVFSSIDSSVLADALAAGNGRIEVLSLGHRYAHLSPLAGIS